MPPDKPWLLLCEDNSKQASALKQWLEPTYYVVIGSTKQNCIEVLEGSKGDPSQEYSVAIIDISFASSGMPLNEDGFDILEVAKQCNYLVPIFYTATANVPKASKALSRGVFRLVSKSQNNPNAGLKSGPLDEL